MVYLCKKLGSFNKLFIHVKCGNDTLLFIHLFYFVFEIPYFGSIEISQLIFISHLTEIDQEICIRCNFYSLKPWKQYINQTFQNSEKEIIYKLSSYLWF